MRGGLARIEEPLCTTVPVLTEAFHLLTPGGIGSQWLIYFVMTQGLHVWYLDAGTLSRAWADGAVCGPPDGSRRRLPCRPDRIKQGHRHLAFEMVS